MQTNPEKSNRSQEPSDGSQERPEAAVEPIYSQSAGLVRRLLNMNGALAVTSYQSGLLYSIGLDPRNGGLHVHHASMPKPMGLAVESPGRFALASGAQMLWMHNVLAPNERVNDLFDACFVPRVIHTTGALDAHDVGITAEGDIIFVNTRFNCLATLDAKHSFREVWRPPFIDNLIDEDRCHLNGLAMRDGAPAYVTAISRSNTIDGWRDRRADGGIVMDVTTGQIVCEGLSMPHSPRWHDGQLWVLNSGTGELGIIRDLETGMGRFEPVVFCPGFLRGLAFHGGFACVGLSKPRYQRFEGLALDQRLKEADSEPWCGVQIIDLTSKTIVDWFRIDGPVAELYDVAVIPGHLTPITVPPGSPEASNLITWNTAADAKPPVSAGTDT